MGIKYSEQSRIFRDFRSIPYSDYYYLIRFYEQYNQDIHYLPLDESMIMDYYYANALFETQEYDTHVLVANRILEQSIIHNIRYIDGEDIYLSTLARKAYAHLKLGEQGTAVKLATQLLCLAPDNKRYARLLRLCFIQERPVWMRPTLTMSAVCILMAAFSLIVLCNWYLDKMTFSALVAPFGLLATGALGLLATFAGYWYFIQLPFLNRQAEAQKKALERQAENEV